LTEQQKCPECGSTYLVRDGETGEVVCRTYCWDKQTGIVLEVTLTQGSTSATYKATSTNLWQAPSNPLAFVSSLPVEILSILISAIVAIAIVATALIYTKRKSG